MEVQSDVIPGKQGKSQPVKLKYDRKTAKVAKEQPFAHRRVFGTARNFNILEKALPERPKWQRPSLKPVLASPPPPIEPGNKTTSNRKTLPSKPVQITPQEPPKTTEPEEAAPMARKVPTTTTQPVETVPPPRDDPPKTVHVVQTIPTAPEGSPKTSELVETAPSGPQEPSKSAELVETAPPTPDEPPKHAQPVQITPQAPDEPPKSANKHKKKNRVSFRGSKRASGAGPTIEREQTPMPAKPKPRVSGTPYHTAERCSKCRFDRMETASYWVTQIKMAEAVGKHSVSAGLFKLALESKAEPVQSLRGELKRYLSRNRCLSGEPEWRCATASYSLNVTPNDQVEVKALDENGGDLDQARDNSPEQITEQLANNSKI